MTDQTTIRVLNVPLYALDITHACDEIIDKCLSGKRLNYCISATGAHGLVMAKKDPHFFQVLNSFYLNLPDGMPGVWVGRLKGAKEMKRCYGPDFFKTLMTNSSGKLVTHYFCGGNEGVADQLKKAVFKKFNNDRIVGTYCPPFMTVDRYNFAEIGERINRTEANIVWIGLSTPKQETFAYQLAKFTNVNFIICVGAAFDFHTEKVKQAPGWIQQIGMEWFYRLCMEPKRLYKRYFEIVPLFIFYNFAELFSFGGKINAK